MKILLTIITIFLSACTSQNLTSIEISKSGDLQFSGKGSAAGVMLMSVMGPAGIAIGISIDAGIAKEINKTATTANIKIENIVKQELRPFLQTQTAPVSVNIDQYGFLIWSGEEENPIIAQLHLTIEISGNSLQVRYPEDFDKELFTPKTVALESVKTHAKDIEQLLSYAADSINQKLLSE